MHTTKVTLNLHVQASSKFIARNEKVVRRILETQHFANLGLRREDIDTGQYQLTFAHTDQEHLQSQVFGLLDAIASIAANYDCILEGEIEEPEGLEWY